ncbi:hypothetical protein [Serratia proteamaculans]|uniref:hypothetical protein n=1 Tax=Serratia proteamaculans TaxID=28151 RepID=UPI0021BB4FEC|nr:hypothetical protein [Serratia proteamaculans]
MQVANELKEKRQRLQQKGPRCPLCTHSWYTVMAYISMRINNSMIYLDILGLLQAQKSPQRELRAFSLLSPDLSGITGDLFGGAGGI